MFVDYGRSSDSCSSVRTYLPAELWKSSKAVDYCRSTDNNDALYVMASCQAAAPSIPRDRDVASKIYKAKKLLVVSKHHGSKVYAVIIP